MFIGDGVVDDFTRQIVNIIGTGLLALLVWMVRRAWKTLSLIPSRLDHLDKCVDSLKLVEQSRYEETMLFRDGVLADRVAQEKEIAELKMEYAGLEGFVKGINGLAIDKPITEINKEGTL